METVVGWQDYKNTASYQKDKTVIDTKKIKKIISQMDKIRKKTNYNAV